MEINDKNIRSVHVKLSEFYLDKSIQEIYEYGPIAISNFQLARKYGEKSNSNICDLMIELQYYFLNNKSIILEENIREFISSCNLTESHVDIKYRLLQEYLGILNNIDIITDKILDEDDYEKIKIDYKKSDARLEEYNIQDLIMAVNEKNVGDITNYAKMIDENFSLDKHLVSIFLKIKYLINVTS